MEKLNLQLKDVPTENGLTISEMEEAVENHQRELDACLEDVKNLNDECPTLEEINEAQNDLFNEYVELVDDLLEDLKSVEDTNTDEE